MRRFKKEGSFDVLRKYSVTLFHMLTTGKLDEKRFEYEMGGKRYGDSSKLESNDPHIKKLIAKFNETIEKLLD